MQTFYEDWFMSQIRLMIAAIIRTVFGRDTAVYEVRDPASQAKTDELYLHLLTLLESGQINEAEDLLFTFLDPDDQSLLLLAVDFYQRLNALSDRELLRHHFSRPEILYGLREVRRIYGLDFIFD